MQFFYFSLINKLCVCVCVHGTTVTLLNVSLYLSSIFKGQFDEKKNIDSMSANLCMSIV